LLKGVYLNVGVVVAEKNSHSAAGQMAGYLFQPERALYWLATSPRGSVIGIETLDDIAAIAEDGSTKLEQAKHYVSNKEPLADRSKELWNTLKIWLDGIQEGEIDLEHTEFFLVTNKAVTEGIVFELMSLADADASRAAWVEKLRVVGQQPPNSVKEIFNSVLGHTDDEIKELISRVKIIDGGESHGAGLRKQIADALHLDPATEDEGLNLLLGWIHDTAITLIRDGQPAWITREAFDEQVRRVIYRFNDQRFVRETAEALIPVSDEERQMRKGRLFVKQLQWLGLPDDDEQIIEAIDDYIRSGTEAINLAQKGHVSPQDFKEFDARLIKRWKTIKRTHSAGGAPSDEEKKQLLGLNILNATMGHREPLAGQETTEPYLTQGAYHRLADEPPDIGWHPEYEQKAAQLRQSTPAENETGDGS
jgi:hypothetical protein